MSEEWEDARGRWINAARAFCSPGQPLGAPARTPSPHTCPATVISRRGWPGHTGSHITVQANTREGGECDDQQ